MVRIIPSKPMGRSKEWLSLGNWRGEVLASVRLAAIVSSVKDKRENTKQRDGGSLVSSRDEEESMSHRAMRGPGAEKRERHFCNSKEQRETEMETEMKMETEAEDKQRERQRDREGGIFINSGK